MDLNNKTIYLLHDDDSYEIVINPQVGKVLEIWRYRDNRTCKPEFCRLEWLDEIIQDRIYDRLARLIEDGQISS
jgi:hypothetical protein